MARTYRYISADGHFESPPEFWTHRVAAPYRDRAPRTIKLADGRDAIVEEGRPLTYGGTSHYAGGPPETFDPTVMHFDSTPGFGSPQQRLAEQDKDGIDAEVIYGLGMRNTAMKDWEAFLAVIRGFNDYLAEEYCSVDPDRLIGVGVLPNSGADADIAEMDRCAKLGLKAVWLATFPSGKSYPTDEDERFYAAAIDLGMPVTIHTSFPTHVGARETPLLKYPNEPQGESRPPTELVQRLARQGPYHTGCVEAAQMTAWGVFERFPQLRIFWAENNIGWIPYYYEQMDHEYEVNRFWVERHLGLKRLKDRPSESLRQAAYWGFFEDRVGIHLRHEVGLDRIMWSTDFPHVVTRWPNSLKVWEAHSAGVPEDEKHKMVVQNAVDFFRLDG